MALPNVYADVSLSLAPNGGYTYYAGQGDFPWTYHNGTYSVASNWGDANYQCLVTLMPDPASIFINPQNDYGLLPLKIRNLMADQPQTFRVSTTIVPGRLIFFSTALNRNSSSGMFTLEPY